VRAALSPLWGWSLSHLAPTACAVGFILVPLLRLRKGPWLHRGAENLVLTHTLKPSQKKEGFIAALKALRHLKSFQQAAKCKLYSGID